MLKSETMRRRIFYFITITLLCFGANFFVLNIESQTKPFTIGQILRAISTPSKNKTALLKKIANDVRSRGVDFPLTAENETLLRNEGATNELIEAIRQNSPPVPTPKPTQTPVSTPKPISTPVSTPLPTPKSTPTVSGKEFKNSIGMEFVRISSGSFMMGSDNGEADEKPVRRVTISNDFWMGKTEVTQGQWKAIMGNNPSSFKDCGNDCPIENISWEDVQDFIRKLNTKGEGTYRLPTEAEWEYACRAGSTTKYSYGDGDGSLGSYAWYSDNSGSKTHQVATKQPNDWGLYDMHGNVWEWCQDWYGSYSSGSVTDPTGASLGSFRVGRGGSWFIYAYGWRSADRYFNTPSVRDINLGFRLVRN